MSFTFNGSSVHLKGVPKPGPSEANLHQLQRMVDTHAIDTCVQFQLFTPEEPPSSPATQDNRVSKVLNKYTKIFQPYSTLPPQRSADHKITLTNNADPVNVRP